MLTAKGIGMEPFGRAQSSTVRSGVPVSLAKAARLKTARFRAPRNSTLAKMAVSGDETTGAVVSGPSFSAFWAALGASGSAFAFGSAGVDAGSMGRPIGLAGRYAKPASLDAIRASS